MKRILLCMFCLLSIFMLIACEKTEQKDVPETETQEAYITSICDTFRNREIIDQDTIIEIVELFKSKEYEERKPRTHAGLGGYSYKFVYSDGTYVDIIMDRDYLATDLKAYNILDKELCGEINDYFFPDDELK